MVKSTKSEKIIRSAFSAAAVFAACSCVFGAAGKLPAATAAKAEINASNRVTLSYEDGKFGKAGVSKLLNQLTGKEDAVYNDVADLLAAKAANPDELKLANAMNATEIASAAGGSYNVIFDDMEWIPVYLSEDINGDVILTLWLTDKLDDKSFFTDTSLGWWEIEENAPYPANMYSSSMVRSHLVGTPYTTDGQTLSAEGVQYRRWADFLAEYDGFLDAPLQVGWQVSQDAKTMLKKIDDTNYSEGYVRIYDYSKYHGTTYDPEIISPSDLSDSVTKLEDFGFEYIMSRLNIQNEAPAPVDGEVYNADASHNFDLDYRKKDTYYDWGTDKLWLPSLTEVGVNLSTYQYSGLVDRNGTYDYVNSKKYNTRIDKYEEYYFHVRHSIGIWQLPQDLFDSAAYNEAWLRSASPNDVDQIYHMGKSHKEMIDAGGLQFYINQASAKPDGGTTNRSVQPAIHLNLSKVYATQCEHETWSWQITEEPTYKSGGVKTYTCEDCHITRTEEVEKLTCPGHEWQITVEKFPDLTESGVWLYTCSICGETQEISTPPLKCEHHEWNGGVVTLAPKAGKEGIKTFTCDKCGETRTETIAALPAEKSEASAALGGEEIAAIALGVFDAALIVGAVAGVLKYFYVKKV